MQVSAGVDGWLDLSSWTATAKSNYGQWGGQVFAPENVLTGTDTYWFSIGDSSHSTRYGVKSMPQWIRLESPNVVTVSGIKFGGGWHQIRSWDLSTSAGVVIASGNKGSTAMSEHLTSVSHQDNVFFFNMHDAADTRELVGLSRIELYGQAQASATGDPHLQNIHGERFDLTKPGKHVLINVPRGESAGEALLRVEAEAHLMGGSCEDMYFQGVNITGAWAEAKQPGGYAFVSGITDNGIPNWLLFGKVELKVAHGHTHTGIKYLNVYVRNLGRAGFPVGGLLGEDDHSEVATLPEACKRKMQLRSSHPDLQKRSDMADGRPVSSSSASASF